MRQGSARTETKSGRFNIVKNLSPRENYNLSPNHPNTKRLLFYPNSGYFIATVVILYFLYSKIDQANNYQSHLLIFHYPIFCFEFLSFGF